jgi:hypothetical protein
LVGASPRAKMILLFHDDDDDDDDDDEDNGQRPCGGIFFSISTQTSATLCTIG